MYEMGGIGIAHVVNETWYVLQHIGQKIPRIGDHFGNACVVVRIILK